MEHSFHQKKHTRTSKKGKVFTAGAAAALTGLVGYRAAGPVKRVAKMAKSIASGARGAAAVRAAKVRRNVTLAKALSKAKPTGLSDFQRIGKVSLRQRAGAVKVREILRRMGR